MKRPEIGKNCFIAPGAVILGDVKLGGDSSVWFGAVIRAERAPIVIGNGSNIQDNAVLHVDAGQSVHIGDGVTVGHGAIVHGCSIGDNTLVGMGAIVLNGAKIGRNCILGAGALVTQNMVIPDNSLAVGCPAQVKRQVTPEEAAANKKNALHYTEESRLYGEELAREND